MLSLDDSFSYDQGMLDVVRDKSGLLRIDDLSDPKNVACDDFWRIGGITESCVVHLSIHSNTGKGEADIESWDYSRLIDVDGIETEEFLFVEMNLQDGFLEIWRGCEVKLSKFAAE